MVKAEISLHKALLPLQHHPCLSKLLKAITLESAHGSFQMQALRGIPFLCPYERPMNLDQSFLHCPPAGAQGDYNQVKGRAGGLMEMRTSAQIICVGDIPH